MRNAELIKLQPVAIFIIGSNRLFFNSLIVKSLLLLKYRFLFRITHSEFRIKYVILLKSGRKVIRCQDNHI